jgi:hypothetical protein
VNIGALGSIGEFIAALATLATLFYLATQIRRSSEATRGASQQALLDTTFDASWELGRDPEHARIVGAGFLAFDALSDRDKTIFALTIQRYVGNLEKGLRLQAAGLVDRETVDQVALGVVVVIRSPGGAEWWNDYKPAAAPIVVQYLAERLATQNNDPTWDQLWPYWARWAASESSNDETAG